MKKYLALLFLFFLIPTHAQVVLDAGHGPSSPGSLSYSGFSEYQATHRIRQKISRELSLLGIKNVLTNQNSTLEGRAKTQGNLFVSLHYDSIPSMLRKKGDGENISGYSVFVSNKNPQYKQSLSCARSIAWGMKYYGEHPALFHQKGLGGNNPRPLVDSSLGVHRFDDLVVLKKAQNAAVLVEMGMWINSKEEVRLMNEATLNTQAKSIAQGIAQCLGK